MSSNLKMGLFNNLEATLYEGVEYINTMAGTVADAQSFQLVPKDKNKWPTDTKAYFTANPCFLYMTLYTEGTGFSAIYKMFFDETLTATPEVITVKGLLAEQPAFGREIPSLTTWPVGTYVSNTSNKQAFFGVLSEGDLGLEELHQEVTKNTEEIVVVKGIATSAGTAAAQAQSSAEQASQSVSTLSPIVEDLTLDVNTNTEALALLGPDVVQAKADITQLETDVAKDATTTEKGRVILATPEQASAGTGNGVVVAKDLTSILTSISDLEILASSITSVEAVSGKAFEFITDSEGNVTASDSVKAVFTTSLPTATETIAGIVRKATSAEAEAGVVTDAFITPALLALAGGGGSGDTLKTVVFEASSEWVSPLTGYIYVKLIHGGGGGGGGCYGSRAAGIGGKGGGRPGYTATGGAKYGASGGGGASGGYSFITAYVIKGQTYNITVGAGGTGGAGATNTSTNAQPGGAGGISSFSGIPAFAGELSAINPVPYVGTLSYVFEYKGLNGGGVSAATNPTGSGASYPGGSGGGPGLPYSGQAVGRNGNSATNIGAGGGGAYYVNGKGGDGYRGQVTIYYYE